MQTFNLLKTVSSQLMGYGLTQQRIARTEAALQESEKLRRELQEEIEIRKQVEWSLQNTSTVLARRTTELQALTDELKKRNQELDAFAHTIAHDLKNPLSGVTTLTELLLETCAQGEPLEAESIKWLRMVNQAGQQALNIIDALLLLAGVSRQRQVEKQLVNMACVVNNVVQQRLAYLIEEYQGILTLPKTWPMVEGYAPWLEEIWSNYLSNGLKYGGQPPHLELGANSENDGMIRFWVHDNGPGLTPAEQAKLFTPFTRLHKKPAPGHGLGLSIVRQIVEKLGGQAGVESTLGQGSYFYFKLPAPRTVLSPVYSPIRGTPWTPQMSANT
jgi:signal transduction histidine kinase